MVLAVVLASAEGPHPPPLPMYVYVNKFKYIEVDGPLSSHPAETKDRNIHAYMYV